MAGAALGNHKTINRAVRCEPIRWIISENAAPLFLSQQTLLEVRAGEKKDGHLAKLPLGVECVGLTSNLGDRRARAPLFFLAHS